MGAVHIPIIDEDALDDLVTAVQALAAPSGTNVAISNTGMHYVTASNAQGAISELDAEAYALNASLAQKQDALEFETWTPTASDFPASANTSSLSFIRWGHICSLVGVLRVTSASAALDILTGIKNSLLPKYVTTYIMAQWYGDNSGCDIVLYQNGTLRVAIPSGSVSKDIKVMGVWICNG